MQLIEVKKNHKKDENQIIKNGIIVRIVKEMRNMNSEEFNNLDEETQCVILFEADKISEKHNEYTKFELFYIRDIFIETRTSIRNHFKRTITTYTLNTLPLLYAAIVQLRFGLKDGNY